MKRIMFIIFLSLCSEIFSQEYSVNQLNAEIIKNEVWVIDNVAQYDQNYNHGGMDVEKIVLGQRPNQLDVYIERGAAQLMIQKDKIKVGARVKVKGKVAITERRVGYPTKNIKSLEMLIYNRDNIIYAGEAKPAEPTLYTNLNYSFIKIRQVSTIDKKYNYSIIGTIVSEPKFAKVRIAPDLPEFTEITFEISDGFDKFPVEADMLNENNADLLKLNLKVICTGHISRKFSNTPLRLGIEKAVIIKDKNSNIFLQPDSFIKPDVAVSMSAAPTPPSGQFTPISELQKKEFPTVCVWGTIKKIAIGRWNTSVVDMVVDDGTASIEVTVKGEAFNSYVKNLKDKINVGSRVILTGEAKKVSIPHTHGKRMLLITSPNGIVAF